MSCDGPDRTGSLLPINTRRIKRVSRHPVCPEFDRYDTLKTSIDSATAFIPVSEYGEFSSMMSLCPILENELGLHPVFIFPQGYGKIHDHGRQVQYRNWSWVQLGSPRNANFFSQSDVDSGAGYYPTAANAPKIDQALANTKVAKERIGTSEYIALYMMLGSLVREKISNRFKKKHEKQSFLNRIPLNWLNQSIKHAKMLFDKLNPALVVSGQDYALSSTSIVALVAERYDVKSVIVPYSMPPTTKELIESFSQIGVNRLNKRTAKRLKKKHPEWVFSFRGVDYSRIRPFEIAYLKAIGLAPPRPWTPNSGRGVMLVPSQQAFDYYKASGVSPTLLRITGASWSDVLVRNKASIGARKAGLLRDIKSRLASLPRQKSHLRTILADVEKVVVVSWPPNQWPRSAVDCNSYQDLCRQFAQSLDSLQESGTACVAISLHPTVTDPEILDLIQQHGLLVVRQSLLNFVDCADIFVSTVSSTTFWALQSGIPSINYDGYLYGYTEFERAGAETVTRVQEMQIKIEALLDNDQLYQKNRQAILDQIDYWSLSDGKSMERIVDTLKALAKPTASSH